MRESLSMKYLIIILLFSSCYTAKKAETQVLKAAVKHPEVLSKIAANLYPPKDSTVFKDVINFDTLYMPEYAEYDTMYLRDTVVITKTVPKMVTKTVEKTKEVYRENTAKVSNQAHQIDNLTRQVITCNTEVTQLGNSVKEYKGKAKRSKRNLILLLIAIGIYVFLNPLFKMIKTVI
jgi:hypothetical protein